MSLIDDAKDMKNYKAMKDKLLASRAYDAGREKGIISTVEGNYGVTPLIKELNGIDPNAQLDDRALQGLAATEAANQNNTSLLLKKFGLGTLEVDPVVAQKWKDSRLR